MKERSSELEIIDRPEQLSPGETRLMLNELARVNRWLGGRSAVLRVLGPLLRERARARLGQPVRLIDFGTGRADIPIALHSWAGSRGLELVTTAVDFNFEICREAQRHLQDGTDIRLVTADALHAPFKRGSCDILLFSAFLHHFEEIVIVRLLAAARDMDPWALVWVDLHRHWAAYWGFRLLSALLSGSAAIRHDGPLSVRKGFRRAELERIVRRAGLEPSLIQWRWAFRYVVVIKLQEGG